jgi:adenylate cyclase
MERKLVAILAADVVGYSRLMEEDELGTFQRLRAHRKELFEPEIDKHHGHIFKLMGDGLLAEFASVVDAVSCAVTLQRGMAGRNSGITENRRIDVRIGVNLGDVIIEGDDRHGEGVNIAARLQQLAEPGGICIARNVYDQVKNKLDLGFRDLGEHVVKNIVDAVHVFSVLVDETKGPTVRLNKPRRKPSLVRIAAPIVAIALLTVTGLLAWLRPWTPDIEAASVARMAFPLPDKPSIAVLPFVNMSGDPKQDYFSDGITEDIISGLSQFGDLFVVARNSVFTYKNKPVKVQQVSEELGVRYVLEGSVQKAADTVRVTAQLVDALSGEHLWSQRYDRALTDVFAVQDELTETIVGTLGTAYGGRLRKAWQERAQPAGPRNFEAFDYLLRGIEYFDRWTREDNKRARELFEKAVQLDPAYGKAYAKIAWTYFVDYFLGWADSPEQALARARQAAEAGIAADDGESWAHWVKGAVDLLEHRYDEAVAAYEKAFALNPNDADVIADYGWALAYAERPTEGIELIKKAMRLNPYYPDWYTHNLGQAYYLAGLYEETLKTYDRLRPPYGASGNAFRAASFVGLGRTDEARQAIAEALKDEPDTSIEVWKRRPIKNPKRLAEFLDALRLAGMPESAPTTLPK